MEEVLIVLRSIFPDLATTEKAVNRHHNYVSQDRHFGKDIDAVMAAQADLVDIVHTLRQVVCVKG